MYINLPNRTPSEQIIDHAERELKRLSVFIISFFATANTKLGQVFMTNDSESEDKDISQGERKEVDENSEISSQELIDHINNAFLNEETEKLANIINLNRIFNKSL